MAPGVCCRSTPCMERFVDSFLCLFILFPSMLFYWRGIWDLYGVYLFPDDTLRCNWATFGLGCFAVLGYFAQPALGAALRRHRVVNNNAILYVVVTRAFMYVYGVAAMAYWRGVWTLADYYLELFEVAPLAGAAAGLAVCFGTLILTRTSRTIIFPPFVVVCDSRPDLLVPSTRLQSKPNWRDARSLTIYALDCILTQYGIVTLTILSWRSMLALYDILLSPAAPAIDIDVLSTIVGVAACILLFSIEGLLAKVSARCRGNYWKTLVWDDVVCVMLFVGEAFLWRGAWNLNARFIIAEPELGGWVNHAIGTVLLMSLRVFSYAGSCGCAIDGANFASAGSEDATSSEDVYPTEYIRFFVHQYRTRNAGENSDKVLPMDSAPSSTPVTSDSSIDRNNSSSTDSSFSKQIRPSISTIS